MSEPKTFDDWAVVEIMGHVRLAGRVREETVFGQALIRVDIPAVDEHPAFTRYFHPQALYSLCPCDEGTALTVAKRERHPPIKTWELPRGVAAIAPRRLDAGPDDDDDEEVDYDGQDEADQEFSR